MNSSDDIVQIHEILPKQEINEDYALVLNYADPFLKKQLLQPQIKDKKKLELEVDISPSEPEHVPIKEEPIVESIVFPSIVYYGIVRQSENPKDRTFLVQVGGMNETFKLNEKKEGVKLLSGTSDKVKMRYKGISKTFEITE